MFLFFAILWHIPCVVHILDIVVILKHINQLFKVFNGVFVCYLGKRLRDVDDFGLL